MKAKPAIIKTTFITMVLFIFSLWISGLSIAEETEAILKPVEYKAQNLRDPFQSPLKKEAETITEVIPEAPPPDLSSLTVQGIVWGGKMPQAIINNKVVKVGDTIEGMRIVSIDKEGITVSQGNRNYNLSSPAAAGKQDLPKQE